MNIYEVAFDMSKQQASCSIRHSTCRMLQVACCFDMLLVWTGLKRFSSKRSLGLCCSVIVLPLAHKWLTGCWLNCAWISS